MAQHGTMRGGVIVPDGPVDLPEGTRVVFESAPSGAGDDDWGDPPPPTGETREEFLAGLREDIAAIKAGAWGKPLDEFMAELRQEFGSPPEGSDSHRVALIRVARRAGRANSVRAATPSAPATGPTGSPPRTVGFPVARRRARH